MKDLLDIILPALRTALPYAKWVEVLDDVLLPPDGVDYPGVGVVDGETVLESRPGRKDQRTDTVQIVPYQQLAYSSVGAAVMGEASLGDEGKSLLTMAEDIRAALNDNLLNNKVLYAHVDAIAASQTIFNEELHFLRYKIVRVTYRRLVS